MTRYTGLFLTLLIFPGWASSQSQEERAAIGRQAIATTLAFYEEPLRGEVSVDLDQMALGEQTTFVADERTLRVVSRPAVHVCSGEERAVTCRLVQTDYLVTPKIVEFGRTEAELEVLLEGNNENPSRVAPVWGRYYRVSLRRSRDGWITVGVQLIAQR